MPLTFSIIEIANITDPDEALDTTFGVDTNNGETGAGSILSFASESGVSTTVNESLVQDDGVQATLSSAVTLNGTNYAAGTQVETDYGFVVYDATADLFFMVSHISINDSYVGAVVSRGFDRNLDQFTDLYTPGNTLEIVDPDLFAPTPGWLTFTQGEEFNNGPDQVYDNDIDIFDNPGLVICFASGTSILRGDGTSVPVETLRAGDLVQTADGDVATIFWHGCTRATEQQMQTSPRFRPIRIAANALAPGVPSEDLRVSRHHRMLIASPIAERMFGSAEVLVSAFRLVGLPGITEEQDSGAVTYHHLLLRSHCVLMANGAPSESLYPGTEALKAVPPSAHAEIRRLLPNIDSPASAPAFARFVPNGHRQQSLINRHKKNAQPLLSGAFTARLPSAADPASAA